MAPGDKTKSDSHGVAVCSRGGLSRPMVVAGWGGVLDWYLYSSLAGRRHSGTREMREADKSVEGLMRKKASTSNRANDGVGDERGFGGELVPRVGSMILEHQHLKVGNSACPD